MIEVVVPGDCFHRVSRFMFKLHCLHRQSFTGHTNHEGIRLPRKMRGSRVVDPVLGIVFVLVLVVIVIIIIINVVIVVVFAIS